jgi:hypothetical protein
MSEYRYLTLLLLLLLLLFTAIQFSPGDSSPYTSTDKTNKNKYTYTKQYKNTVQTIQNTVNTSTYEPRYHVHVLTKHPHITTAAGARSGEDGGWTSFCFPA